MDLQEVADVDLGVEVRKKRDREQGSLGIGVGQGKSILNVPAATHSVWMVTGAV